MPNVELGRLEEVDVREIWSDEAQDFTPWLAEHLDELGAALHLDLQLVESEGAVGSFAVDIVADSGSGLVVIENQLERTDHSHLGQVMTYAAGRDARTLIWITPEFRDEHRATLDWLNRWTTNEIEAYGVEVRAVRIGDSLVAPEFRPVAFPNSWSRQARSQGAEGSMSGDEQRRRIAFFEQLVRKAHQLRLTDSPSSGLVARSKSFHLKDRRPGCLYWADLRARQARVTLEIKQDSERRVRQIHDALDEQWEDVSRELDDSPALVISPMGAWVNVRVNQDASIDDPPERQEQTQRWILNTLEGFQRVLEPRLTEIIRNLDAEEPKPIDESPASDDLH